MTKQPDEPAPASTSSTASPTPTATVTVTASPTNSASSARPTSSASAPGEPTEKPKPTSSATQTDRPDPSPTQTDEPDEPEPEPTDDPPSDPPAQVTGVSVVEDKTDHEQLTLEWKAAADDEGIKHYVISLNGHPMTAQHPESPTEGTISWLNGEEGFFVQVAAVDTDGQEGPKSDWVTVERPADPSPSPSAPESEPEPTS